MQAHCSGEGSGQVVFRSRSGIKEKEKKKLQLVQVVKRNSLEGAY